jgi:hypothetical protein
MKEDVSIIKDLGIHKFSILGGDGRRFGGSVIFVSKPEIYCIYTT